MKAIFYIHGANSTSKSFSYIRKCLPEHNAINIEYSVQVPLETNIKNISKKLEEYAEPVHIIAHSIGGIIGLAVSQINKNIINLTTLGTPFAGSREANLLLIWLPNNQLYRDISTISPAISKSLRKGGTLPMLSFVSTDGRTDLINKPNDGVVTIESQMALVGPEYIKIKANHFETLLNDEVVERIKNFIWNPVA
jgi:hypothetical protein